VQYNQTKMMHEDELLTLCNELRQETELLFGESINDWIFTGIEINDRTPSLMYYPETKSVSISLSKKVTENDLQLIFQLSHEACHLLHPSMELKTLIQNPPLVINEGLSTFYSILKVEDFFNCGEFMIENLRT
jgi:hypothetical protein